MSSVSSDRIEDKLLVQSKGENSSSKLRWRLVIFVHYDGRVVMKTIHCLFINEKILIDGIQMIDPDRKRPLFSPAGDRPLKKHLKHNPINVTPYGSFESEQHFSKTVTPEEMIISQPHIMTANKPVIDLRGTHIRL